MTDYPNSQGNMSGATPAWVGDPATGYYIKPNSDGSINTSPSSSSTQKVDLTKVNGMAVSSTNPVPIKTGLITVRGGFTPNTSGTWGVAEIYGPSGASGVQEVDTGFGAATSIQFTLLRLLQPVSGTYTSTNNFALYIFNDQPSGGTYTDDGLLVLSAGDKTKLVDIVAMNAAAGNLVGTPEISYRGAPASVLTTNSAGKFYFILVWNAAPNFGTPGANSWIAQFAPA